MVKGVTSTGFKFEVDENVIKKWKFIKLAKLMKTDPTLLCDIGELILGEKFADLEQHTEDNGDGLAEFLDNELKEILEACGEEIKNS